MAYKSKEQEREYQRKYREEHKEYIREQRAKRKMEALLHYCRENQLSCAMCGVEDIDLLCLDHINNDGYKHRQTLRGNSKDGINMYDFVRQKNYPSGFQVLCWNCNAKKEVNRRRGIMDGK